MKTFFLLAVLPGGVSPAALVATGLIAVPPLALAVFYAVFFAGLLALPFWWRAKYLQPEHAAWKMSKEEVDADCASLDLMMQK